MYLCEDERLSNTSADPSATKTVAFVVAKMGMLHRRLLKLDIVDLLYNTGCPDTLARTPHHFANRPKAQK